MLKFPVGPVVTNASALGFKLNVAPELCPGSNDQRKATHIANKVRIKIVLMGYLSKNITK